MSRANKKGRKPLDLAFRLRNWGWYWLLKNATRLSDEDLDERYVWSKDLQPSLFQSIRRMGSSPDENKGFDRGRVSLYERVHKDGAFPVAKAWFESTLWTFVTEKNLPTSRFSQFIDETVKKENWYRVRGVDRTIAGVVLGDRDPILEQPGGSLHQAMLTHLGSRRDPDSVALLIALFREAHAGFVLKGLEDLRVVTSVAVAQLWRSYSLPDEFGDVFERVICDRGLFGLWVGIDDHVFPAVARRESPHATLKRFCSWYIQESWRQDLASSAHQVVVRGTRRTAWLEANRQRLHEAFKPVRDFEWDTDEAHYRESARELNRYFALVASVGDSMRQFEIPPPPEGPVALPIPEGSRMTFTWFENDSEQHSYKDPLEPMNRPEDRDPSV